MAILTTDDFQNGRFIIPTNQETVIDLTMYIERIENQYLPQLFGKELYDLFIADLALPVAGEPTAPRFVKVFEPFVEQPDDCRLYESTGIKDMLKGLVYYHYVKDDTSRVTNIGIKLTDGENSQNVTAVHHDILNRYNEAICTYRSIQWWMDQEDPDTYPEYAGIHKNYNHNF